MIFVRPKNGEKVPVILASAQTDMFAAEYRSETDNTSSLHCRVIKIQHQMERLCLNRNLIGLQPTALITYSAPQLGPMQFSQAEHKSNKVFRHALQRVVLTKSEHQTEQVRLSRHFI